MEVILREHIENLGKMGDIVSVKSGYARNFLIPKGKAIRADRSNKKALEHQLRLVESKRMKELASLEDKAEKITTLSLTIRKKVGESDRLFGSVTTLEIVEALKNENIRITKDQVRLEEPIRTRGVFNVPIRFSENIIPTLKLWVVEE